MVLRTVKFSIVLVNSLCFDLNFALRGFTNHAFVLSCRGTRNNKTCAAKCGNVKAPYFSSVTQRFSAANGEIFKCAC